ncbi:DHS-like NAD/FAD-binding domain-containing protein [Exidia glandulosa HHB12029]|uniref:NAD-dependent protein deacylase n=1 Tax=Exidia glandulosa HHB12029 TaxID=1314781 RepID=A0A165ESL2_EXIGL|nr:DHS-like NAD/FAD-binding domain-containing protein [Exidia glandulosa HHB12029]
MAAFGAALRASKNIIAVCGAGLSAASGIPTFRGAGGLWRKYDAISLATPEAFAENPSRVWQFYHYRRESALKAEPNAAHYALGLLTQSDSRALLAPACANFKIITQNVDGLSPRAHTKLPSPEQAAASTIEMHGRIHDVICTSCEKTTFDASSPICPALAGTEAIVATGHEEAEPQIEEADLPRCKEPGCDGLLRPGVVWFGERPHRLAEIDEYVERADLCLVVGTSSTVYPAASYAEEVKSHGGRVAVFNLDRSQGDGDADFLFLGPCEETLPRALGIVT